ncbi:MAG: HAMP domain-containing protein [Spirochaetia bacterium]|nr:HAMP domain-containing protein [Spirochaetia bacterium]
MENNGLDEAESFVQAYKQRALKRMEEMNKSAKGSLLVYDVTNNSFLNSIEGGDTRTYEGILMKTTGEVYFSEALNDFYMIESFPPWNWKIIAIASDEELHAELDSLRTRNIILSIVIGMIFSVLLRYAIRRLIIKPLKTLENAAEAVQVGSNISNIEIRTKDEIGMLARTLEQMSSTIGQQQEELKELNKGLEEKVEVQHRVLLTINKQLREENERRSIVEKDLQKALTEKENLIREIHHRVKNNLAQLYSLVDLERDEIKNSSCIESYQKLQNRIEAMGLVHRQLYQAKSIHRIPAKHYFTELLTLLRRSLHSESRGITIEGDIQEIELHIDMIQTLGLLVTELITNAVKHAFPGDGGGTVWVVLHRGRDNELLLEVGDNGVGYTQGEKSPIDGSIGQIIISAMVEQLDGRMEAHTHNGTTIQIRFLEEEVA